MPYSSISQLPSGVRKNLPSGAQVVYMKAFNSALKSYKGNEQLAAKVAWAAVKRLYKKVGDKWVKK